MTNLISQLEGAKEGSRELDEAIFIEFFGSAHVVIDAPPYSDSVNDGMELALKVLPSDFIDIEVSHRVSMGRISSGSADICGPSVDASAHAATPALALCIAILKAKGAGDDGR